MIKHTTHKANIAYSLYRSQKHRRDRIGNLGYDYRGQHAERNFSRSIKQNEIFRPILSLVNTLIDEMILSVKSIKARVNYCVDSDTDLIN